MLQAYTPDNNLISSFIAKIDELIARQLQCILHHVKFQRLEASWRGLYYLTQQNPTVAQDKQLIKVKVCNMAWQELAKDLSRAVEFDQSQLFAKIYSQEFGHPGGEPFGLLIGDYYLTHLNQANQSVNDISTLEALAKVAAAAFAPFITSVKPSFLGLADYADLDRPLDLQRIFQQVEYQQWRKLREAEDARFIGLVLPQILLREPHAASSYFNFTENTVLAQDYLWGNAVYAFAAVVMRAFNHYGWFAEIRGQANQRAGGIVMDLPKAHFRTDSVAEKLQTNYCITDSAEKLLSDQGLIALTHNQYRNQSVFYACPSIQRAHCYTRSNASVNAKLSAMLHYMLCVSRFAHYLKVIARDKIGRLLNAKDIQAELHAWLNRYSTASSTDLSEEMKAQYPLREAKVEVFQAVGRSDKLLCTIHLSPHYQFDQLETYLQLRTELTKTT